MVTILRSSLHLSFKCFCSMDYFIYFLNSLFNGLLYHLEYCLQFQASKASVVEQIHNGKSLLSSGSGSSDAFALIIDGKSLTYALEDDVKNMFLDLAIGCASVICCRSSPKQKALVSSDNFSL